MVHIAVFEIFLYGKDLPDGFPGHEAHNMLRFRATLRKHLLHGRVVVSCWRALLLPLDCKQTYITRGKDFIVIQYDTASSRQKGQNEIERQRRQY